MKDSYSISIPKDKSGYTHRACAVCRYRFGIKGETLPDKVYCSYCGEKSLVDDCNTEEQIEYAIEEAKNQIFQNVQKEFQGMMKKTFSGSKNVSFKPGRISKTYVFPPQQSQIPNEAICSSCEGDYIIFGIASTCPYCGQDDIKLMDANLSIIEKEINNNRALRQVYNDLVIAFQNECQFFAGKVKGVNFQNINVAEKHFREKHSIEMLDNVSQESLKDMRTAFEKRHVEQHSRGVYDEKYVANLQEDTSLIGRKVEYSKEELLSALKAFVTISDNLRKNITPSTK